MEFTGFSKQFVSKIIQVKYLIGSICHVLFRFPSQIVLELEVFGVSHGLKPFSHAAATVEHPCIYIYTSPKLVYFFKYFIPVGIYPNISNVHVFPTTTTTM